MVNFYVNTQCSIRFSTNTQIIILLQLADCGIYFWGVWLWEVIHLINLLCLLTSCIHSVYDIKVMTLRTVSSKNSFCYLNILNLISILIDVIYMTQILLQTFCPRTLILLSFPVVMVCCNNIIQPDIMWTRHKAGFRNT